VNNGELGGGVQGVVPVVGPIDLELSVSRFNDSLDITKMSLLQFAATLRYNYELSKSSKVYIGGGIDYNQMTADIIGGAVKVQMENVVGYHGTIGLETVVKKSWVLFLDCRFTKLATTAVVSGNGQSEVVEGTYDHGLLRAGVNFLF
jgi:outer membrane protein W